ncbi:DUF222 domain-containing protein, partial [Geodermatophilus obscurus]|uniref:DUF222 domain-containing protein n=1 Tax=Geodermatophilus obscurus TaxID=1861 RepID=UPI001160C3FF
MGDVLTAAAAPPVGLSCGPLGAVQAADREIGRQTALRARAVAEFAASRPASVDRPPGSAGAMSAERWAGRAEVLRPVSEWATQELAIALSLTGEAAQSLLERSLILVHRLPATLEALEAGVLHPGHLWPLLDKVAPIADDAVRAALERDLLAWAGRRGTVCTPAQLGDKARREVLKRAARSAADDLARAVRQRGVSGRPDRVDGMGTVSALLTTPEAAALMAALGACADALPEDGRTRGQKMADCLLDLVLRPTESGLPPVQVTLDVVAPLGALLGGDQPCEIDGQVVPAEMVRALLAALTGHPLVTTTDTGQDDSAQDDSAQDDSAQDDSAATDTTPADTAQDDSTPADSAPADAAQADAEAPDPALVDPARATGPALGEDEDFALWAEQLEDRILAGDFDAEPPPDAPDEDHPPPVIDSPAAPDPTVPDGWWARADAAVDDASAAVLTAQQALGHASRLVATARRADTTDETTWATGPAGRVTAAPDTLTQLHAATGRARDTLTALLGATAGG